MPKNINIYWEKLAPVLLKTQQAAANIASKLKENFAKHEPEVRELAKEGWFIDDISCSCFLMPFYLKNKENDNNSVELFLIAHFESRFNDIENYLSNNFSKRAHIIKAAFKAHRNEDYELSVPVFLAQADGICKEFTDVDFFTTKKKEEEFFKKIENEYLKAYASVFNDKDLKIKQSKKKRGLNFNNLNRHMVIHGESVNYGTKENSLKALSLLNFMAITIKEFSRNSQQQ